jgi:hypothetical protein
MSDFWFSVFVYAMIASAIVSVVLDVWAFFTLKGVERRMEERYRAAPRG